MRSATSTSTSGDILVQPGETSHKAYGDGDHAMLAIVEFAH